MIWFDSVHMDATSILKSGKLVYVKDAVKSTIGRLGWGCWHLGRKEIYEEDVLISKIDSKTKMHLKVILQARHRNHCCKANVGGLLTTNNR